MGHPRSVLLLRSARATQRMIFRLLGIAAILGMAVGMYVGIHSAMRSLYGTRDAYYRKLDAADAEIRFVPEDLANLPDFSGIAGLDSWAARLVASGQLRLAGDDRYPAVVVAQPRSASSINRLQILAGKPLDPADPAGVLIDRNFAAYHHLSPGDHLVLIMGNAQYQLTVRGIALSPEYLVAPAIPSFFLPVKGSMGVVYAPIQMIANRLGFTLVDSLVFRFARSVHAKPFLLNTLTERAKSTLSVQESLTRAQHLGHLFLDVDLNAFAIFVPAVIVIFMLAALVVGFFLVYRWVASQRQIFGVLLALGFSRWRLLAAEIYPVAIIGLGALIIALPVSAVVLHDFADTYSAAVGLPSPQLHFYPAIALRGAVALVIVILVMVAWPLSEVLRLTPIVAIRRAGLSANGHKTWHTRLLRRLRHHPFLVFPVRNVLRSARIGTMTVTAIALAIGVSISYFIATDSFNQAIADSFTADTWNVAVDFLVPVWHDELGPFTSLPGITQLEEVLRGPVRLSAHGGTQPATITGYDPLKTMRRLALISGKLPADSSDGIVLEYKLARSLGLRVGDPVGLTSENHHYALHVAGIFSGAVPGTAYAPIATVRRWLNMPNQLTGLLLRARDPSRSMLAELRKLPHVGAVTPKTRLIVKVREISNEAVAIIYLSATFSIVVCIIILIASGTFTVSERRELYTTLRTLGFSDRSVSRLILAELCVLGILGAVLATPVGYGMAAFLIGKLSQAGVRVVPRLSWRDILLPTLPLVVLLPLSAMPAVRSVIGIPLGEAIKERKFG